MNNPELLKKLNELFGSYRAEWLRGKIFDFFAEPSYFTALKDNRPCVLQGGRGTGKTTVLRGLSYQGQFALHNNSIEDFDKQDFIGLYHRVNTNHVRAFIGGQLSDDKWQMIFAHYFNLIVCREILIFIKWHKSKSPNDEDLSSYSCNLVRMSMHISDKCINLSQLLDCIETSMYEFQAQINNIADDSNVPILSMPGDPINIVTEQALLLSQFKDKMFYIMLDEYENLEDNQQQIINTLIKHSTEYYTFKIGVRELGWRVKHTLNKEELLYDPADYVLINIEKKFTEESYFEEFAKNVCQQRIQQLIIPSDNESKYSIEEALTGLNMEEEAILLKIKQSELFLSFSELPKEIQNQILDLSPLYKFFIAYWAKTHSKSLNDTVAEYLDNIGKWNTRYDNYKYSMLFKIRKGRGMGGIQKYYAGWNTYIKLANGNIRYLMELVYRAYEKHLNNGIDIKTPVSPEDQTFASQDVGKKNLMELEGLWKNGAKLTKMLLGFGRIFNVLATDEVKIAPETNQFTFEEALSKEGNEIISAAVMNLALIRIPGNKLSDQSSTRDYIYAIHPIFASYFCFSHRRKRRMIINEEELLGVIEKPKEFINSILAKSNIVFSENKYLPQQLSLFEEFYND